jgi:N-methylhydantoinase A/oxoprolinase/acetone carboxylase beta subunit
VEAASFSVETAIHGTTLITNALIERKGARTALICTRGFRDILEMRREMRYDIYDLQIVLPEPLVPRPLRLEVDERLDWRGAVITPLDTAGLEELRPALQDGVQAVAVCLLHAFANPDHERRVGEWLRQNFPEAAVSLSSEVSPEIREYERMSTTVCNAYVQPLTQRYLARLTTDLAEAGFQRQLYLMLSGGGITTAETGARFPVRLVESGPAGGVLAAMFYGDIVGERDMVSLDVGGTTAKICLIQAGRPGMASDFEIARVHRFKRGSGLPVRVPTIELIEIGAGGGSLARVDALGLIKVGPESAGADPGPACYGLGGERPTVTDAALVLGYLNPDYFLGGRMRLDPAAAERAVTEVLAGPLGLSVPQAAHAILKVVNENMIAATRIHIAERGADARRLMLMAFGGAGPIHAHEIARALKMRGYICPAGAGVVSALGFLTAPKSFDFTRTHVARLTQSELAHLDGIFAELETEGRATLAAAGVPDADMQFIREADLRHVGQGHEIAMPLPYARLADVDLERELQPRFYEWYERLFGHAHRHLGLELTTCRLRATGPRPEVRLRPLDAGPANRPGSPKGRRPVFFVDAGGYVDTPVYDRSELAAGQTFAGPTIVEEANSTAVIGPGAVVQVDLFANLIARFADQVA